MYFFMATAKSVRGMAQMRYRGETGGFYKVIVFNNINN